MAVTKSVVLRIRSCNEGENTPLHYGANPLNAEQEDVILDSVLGPEPEEKPEGVRLLADDEKPADDTVEMTTSALLIEDGGRITLRYRETELSGLDGAQTELSFLASEPGVVTISRTGAVRCTLVLEKGKFHTSAYSISGMALDMTTAAYRVNNTLTETGGELDALYNLRIGAAVTSRIRLQVKILSGN